MSSPQVTWDAQPQQANPAALDIQWDDEKKDDTAKPPANEGGPTARFLTRFTGLPAHDIAEHPNAYLNPFSREYWQKGSEERAAETANPPQFEMPGAQTYRDIKSGNYAGAAGDVAGTAVAVAPYLMGRVGRPAGIPESAAVSPARTLPGALPRETFVHPQPTAPPVEPQPIPPRSGLMLKGDVNPGGPLPETPSPELLQSRVLQTGAQPVLNPSTALGRIRTPQAVPAEPPAPAAQAPAKAAAPRATAATPKGSPFEATDAKAWQRYPAVGSNQDVAETGDIQAQARETADREQRGRLARGNEEGYARNTRARTPKGELIERFKGVEPVGTKPAEAAPAPVDLSKDLTPILEQSVAKVNAEKAAVAPPEPTAPAPEPPKPEPAITEKPESAVDARNRAEAQRLNEAELAKGTKADAFRRQAKAEGHGEEWTESYIRSRPEEFEESPNVDTYAKPARNKEPLPGTKLTSQQIADIEDKMARGGSKPKATRSRAQSKAIPAEKAETLEQRATREGAQPVTPPATVPKEGSNFEGRYVEESLKPVQNAWDESSAKYADHQISWNKITDSRLEDRDGVQVNMHDPKGNYVASLNVHKTRDGFEILAKGSLKEPAGKYGGNEVWQTVGRTNTLARAKEIAEARLRSGQVYSTTDPWYGSGYSKAPDIPFSKVRPYSQIDPTATRPTKFTQDKLLIKVPDDGTFVIPNTPASISRAMRVTENFPPVQEPKSFARRVPKSPTEFNPEKHIVNLEREIADLEDQIKKAGAMQKPYYEEQLKAARENLAEARGAAR